MAGPGELLGQLDLEDLQFLASNVDKGDPQYSLIEQAISSKRGAQWKPDPGAKARNLERAGVEGGLAEQNYETAENPTRGMATKQLAGTAAMGLNLLPPVGRALEATGDLAQTLLPGQRENIAKVLPTPGSIERNIEEMPSQTLGSTVAGLAPIAGAAGLAGRTAQAASKAVLAPYTAPYSSVLEMAKRGMPGRPMLPHLAAGGASTLPVALGDKVYRQAEQAASGQPVEPMRVSDVTDPVAFGAAMGAVPGGAEALRNPRTKGGRIASKYAAAKESGTAKVVAEEEANVSPDAPEPPSPMERAEIERAESLGSAGRKVEEQFRVRNAGMRAEDQEQYRRGLRRGGVMEPFVDLEEPKPPTTQAGHDLYDMKPFHDKVAEIVERHGRSDTPELRTKLGDSLEDLRQRMGIFLQDRATAPDIRNAIKELHTFGKSSDAATRFPYNEIESELRSYAKNYIPGERELAAGYAKGASTREEGNRIVYGKGKETENIGERRKVAETPEGDDVPDIPPEEQRKGGKVLMSETSAGDTAPEYQRLRQLDPEYGDILDEAGMAKKAAEGRYAEREALEMSKFMPVDKWAHSAALVGAGMLPPPGGHKLSMATRGATHILPQFAQALRSRAAYRLPSNEALGATIPNLMLFSQQAQAARERIGSTSKDLVDKAKQQVAKLRQ